MIQLICHLIGDYLLQTDQMAAEKTKRFDIALLHAFVYSVPFGLVAWVPVALGYESYLDLSRVAFLTIFLTHALIDHFRVARYLVWAKNQLARKPYRYAFSEAAWHGYRKDKPEWLAGWLLILADNILHLTINALSVEFL